MLPLAKRDQITPQVSEYFALLLLATLGMGFVVTSRNLLGAFVALELVSLSLYAMTVLNQASRASAEAALKYLTFGAVSSGFLLFGLSYLYGATGQLDLTQMQDLQHSPILVLAYLLIFVGLGFKLALAPFHLWAPDVYQGSPTAVTLFFAALPKIAALTVFIRFLYAPFINLIDQWQIPASTYLHNVSRKAGEVDIRARKSPLRRGGLDHGWTTGSERPESRRPSSGRP